MSVEFADRSYAEDLQTKLKRLNTARQKHLPIDSETARWLHGLNGRFLRRLVKYGYVTEGTLWPDTVVAFVLKYLAHRAKGQGQRTQTSMQNELTPLLKHFTGETRLDEVGPADADELVLQQRAAGKSEATMSRRIARWKEVFDAAHKRKLIAENPFAHIRRGSQKNDSRLFYITRDDTHRLLEACPDDEWRALIALVRFAGLRCPSETSQIQWGDIDFEASRLRIPSPQSERRFDCVFREAPLSIELRAVLEVARESANPEERKVVSRICCSQDQNPRTQLNRIVKHAGVGPWQKPFVNLRGSAVADLLGLYPLPSVCVWTGMSAQTAMTYYRRVIGKDFELAASVQITHDRSH